MNNHFFIMSFILISLVILVNGWTDAPNAITSCVVTKSLSIKKVIILSVIFNFLGILIMTSISNKVVDTVSNLVYFPNNNEYSIIALCAGMLSVIIWSVLAWFFGIPTSESHALLAGITGAAISLNKGFSCINLNEWIKVLYGLILSCSCGIVFSYSLSYFLSKRIRKTKLEKYQIMLCSLLSFFHGAQDGQKFIGVFIILLSLSSNVHITVIPLWIILYCAIMMGIGTSFGGGRIIKTIGEKIINIDKLDGVITDFVSTICIFSATLLGFPVSTTHVRTLSIVGVGLNKKDKINLNTLSNLIFTWIMTFPCCGLIGYLLSEFMQ